MSDFSNPLPNARTIPLATALQIYRENQIDAFALAFGKLQSVPKACDLIKNLKFRGIDRVLNFINYFGQLKLYWLDPQKSLIAYLETNLIDACNLNCKACTHFAALYSKDEIYPLDEFAHDVQTISESIDVQHFRLLGGEPLLLKNLDEYLDIARRFFPQTLLSVVSNGLLIPNAPQKIFESMRRNSINIDISSYLPTMKIAPKIVETLRNEGIYFSFTTPMEEFHKIISDGTKIYNPLKAREHCSNDVCRFLRRGKIYKCPIDALKYRFAEKFNLNYPPAISVDIHAKNFTLMLDMLDGNVDQCHFCYDHISEIPWETTSNPTAQDWIV